MGIILLIAGILVATIIVKTICDKAYQRYWDGHYENKKPSKFDQACYDNSEALAVIFWLILICTITILIVCSIIMLVNYIQVDSFIATNTEIYNSLIYKMESTTCRDEFGFLNKEVIDEVQEWNQDVKYIQAAQDDFWVGIFHPNVFDEFKTIDYESYNK